MATTAAREQPVPPYGVAPVDVLASVPVGDIPDTQPDGTRTSVPTVESVVRWIEQVSTIVRVTIGDATRISDTGRQQVIAESAAAVVCLGAASYLASAAFPSRNGVNSGSLSEVLWTRYEDALGKLLAMITMWIADGGDDVNPEPGGSGGSAMFPCTAFPDYLVL